MFGITNNQELIAKLTADTCKSISITSYDDATIEKLKPLIAKSKNLKSISFSGFDRFNNHLMLADAIKASMITNLEIPYDNKYIPILKAVCENKGRELNLTFDSFMKETAVFNIADLSNLHKISSIKCLLTLSTELPIFLVQLITNSPNLKELSLMCFSINDQNAKLINDFLAEVAICSSLQFICCKFSKHALEELFDAIRKNHNIQEADIRFCGINSEVLQYSSEALTWSYLKKLTLYTEAIKEANQARTIAAEVKSRRKDILNAWDQFCLINNRFAKTQENKMQTLSSGPMRKIAEYLNIKSRPQLEVEVSTPDETPDYLRNMGLYSDIM